MNYSNIIEDNNVSETDDSPLGERFSAFYLASTLVSFTAIVAVTVPATMVIITIVYKRELHKYHYWLVANLMVCNILSALSIAPIFITLDLLKLLKVAGKAVVSCNVVFGIFDTDHNSPGMQWLELASWSSIQPLMQHWPLRFL